MVQIWRYSGTDGIAYSALEQVDCSTAMQNGDVKNEVLLAGGTNGYLRYALWLNKFLVYGTYIVL